MAKYYVYELVDPETDKPFYIGKGKGGRMYAHGKPCDKNNLEKIKLINKIGYNNVVRRKLKEFELEQDAYKYEAELIKHTNGLVNIAKNEGKARTTKDKHISLTSMIYKLFLNLIEFKKGKLKEIDLINYCLNIIIKFPYRVICDKFSKEYNTLLDIPENIINSMGYKIKYSSGNFVIGRV